MRSTGGPVAVLLVCFACSLAILWPILSTPSWYVANQAYRYPYLLAMFRDQFLAGQWYPRWLPELAGGYGYPTFVYYPPGFWFSALPFVLLGMDEVNACKVVLLVALILGGTGAYLIARRFCGRQLSFVVVMCFYLTPYLSTQLYERGSLSELLAAMACPWTLYYLLHLHAVAGDRWKCLRSSIGVAVSLAATILFHPIIAFWLAITIGVCTLGLILGNRHSKPFLAAVVAAAALALAATAIYWWVAFSLRDAIDFTRAVQRVHLIDVPLAELLGGRIVGPVLPVVALVGLLTGRGRIGFRVSVAASLLALIAYLLPLSHEFRAHASVSSYLQMPIRTISVVTSIMVPGVALLLRRIAERGPITQWLFCTVLVGGLLFLAAHGNGYSLRAPLHYPAFAQERRGTFDNMTHFDEFHPLGSSVDLLDVRMPSDSIVVASNATVTMTFNRANANIDFRFIANADRAGLLTIRQTYFPGWHISVNAGVPKPCHHAGLQQVKFCVSQVGLMQLWLPKAGEYEVHVWFALDYTSR